MEPFQTYAEALNYIYVLTKPSRKKLPKFVQDNDELGRMRHLMDRLGNPQRTYPVILVAGTKGKGSTAGMCESILRAAGYKTGLTTSPRLHTYRERIRIAGQPISEADVIELANRLAPHFNAIEHLITFERITAMAFLAFAQAQIDVAVVEVGIGGRLDATNVTEPEVAVITSISYDHMHLLGNTLSDIAREKAGIIRPHGRVISAPQYPEAMTVLETVCLEREAQLTVAGDHVPFRIGKTSLNGQAIYIGQQSYHLPLLGSHQVANAATAVAAIEALQTRTALRVSPEAVGQGLAMVRVPGRLEILSQAPFLIVDGAMNGDSAMKLRQTLTHYFPGRSILLIFGASRDHDYTIMLRELLPIARHAIVARSTSFKAADPEALADAAEALGYEVAVNATIPQALQTALSQAEALDIICVTGSLFCVADARLAWAEYAGLPLPETDPV